MMSETPFLINKDKRCRGPGTRGNNVPLTCDLNLWNGREFGEQHSREVWGQNQGKRVEQLVTEKKRR